MGNQLAGPDRVENTETLHGLPKLSTEEALEIRNRVLREFPDLPRSLKTIIAERLVLLARRLKAAQERLRRAKERGAEDEISEAEADVHIRKFILLVDPLTNQISAQIKIEREQAEINRIATMLADL